MISKNKILNILNYKKAKFSKLKNKIINNIFLLNHIGKIRFKIKNNKNYNRLSNIKTSKENKLFIYKNYRKLKIFIIKNIKK